MTSDRVHEMLRDKFGVLGIREGNTIWVDALLKDVGKLVRLVVVLEQEQVLRMSVYQHHADLNIPGTERDMKEVLERFF